MVAASATGLLPVLLFLGALLLLDSYRLIPLRAIVLAIAAGALAAAVAYGANRWLQTALALDLARYSRYVAPVVEELLKASYVAWLFRRSRVGFVADAATYGFATGTGFALVENVLLLQGHPSATIWAWVVRGFGTALMHGGTTAIVATMTRTLQRRETAFHLALVLPGLAVAMVVHSLYNQFLVAPLLATALIMLVLPGIMLALFRKSERETGAWLGTGFDMDQELLRLTRAGALADTPVGRYLRDLRTSYPPEVIVDIMCLLRMRAELGVRAKGMLLLREAGFEP